MNESRNQQAWLYTFAEESLVSFAEQIEQDIPESCLFIKPDNLQIVLEFQLRQIDLFL